MRADIGVRARTKDVLMRASARLHLDAAARAVVSRLGPSVRVMVLHGTPARHADALEVQLRWVRQRFGILDPDELFALLDGKVPPPTRPAVVFTFDDGLASNASVAAPLLEQFGTRGIFFVCPYFAELRGEHARQFFTTKVRLVDDPKGIPEEDFAPMDEDAMRALRRRGHVIGNHTRTHSDLRKVSGDEATAEIIGARDRLSSWLDEQVTSFAWTLSWDAITRETWSEALRGHRYCFTACPGRGAIAPGCVWRTNVEADLDAGAYPFFYSGLADPIWWSRRRRIARLFRASAQG